MRQGKDESILPMPSDVDAILNITLTGSVDQKKKLYVALHLIYKLSLDLFDACGMFETKKIGG